jgi:hypothetical protein
LCLLAIWVTTAFMIQSHINCRQILQACKFILFVDCFYLFKVVIFVIYAISLVYCIMQKSCWQQLKWDSSLFCFSHGFSQLSVSGYFECYETSITNAIQLPYGDPTYCLFWKILGFRNMSRNSLSQSSGDIFTNLVGLATL